MEMVVKAVSENKEVWKKIEKINNKRRQPDARLLHLNGQKKKVARRAVDKARNDMKEEVMHNKLEEDGGSWRWRHSTS